MLLDGFVSVTFDDRDQVIDAGLLEILSRNLDHLGIDLVREHPAARLAHCQSHPDRRIATRRPDFDYPLGSGGFG